jgi:hypothetical protein
MNSLRKFVFLTVLLLGSISANAKFALTASGGVSLGVYEAGFLYYIMQKSPQNIRNKDIFITGASAGAINSFITIMEKCSELSDDPQQSLFWKSWMPLNFDKFFLREYQQVNSLLQRESFDDIFNMFRRRWNAGLRKGCNSTLGVTVTRKKPLIYHEGSKLDYSRVAESVVLKIEGQGYGKVPKVSNVYVKGGGIQMFLPFNQKEYNNFELIKDLLMATSSFPLAFEPTFLDHCIISPKAEKKCSKENIRKDLFVDGGVFNNTPLDLAYKIAKGRNKHNDIRYIFLDPSIKEYPIATKEDFNDYEASLFKDFLTFFKNFISASRRGQISSFLSNHPELGDRLVPLKGSMPLASEPLYGFAGFFEEDFRIFDFYIGMVDGKRAVNQNKYTPISLAEFDKLSVDWQWVTCLEAAYNGDTKVARFCSGDDSSTSKNIVKLFKVSIERLFSNCSRLSDYKNLESNICKMAREGRGPEDYFGSWATDWKKRDKESELGYVLRRLEHYQFHFKDLGLKPTQSKIAIVKMKDKMTSAVKLATKSQPKDHQFVLNQFASPFMNFVYYTPTPVENYILGSGNSVDIGRSTVFSRDNLFASYWRYGFGIMGLGIDSLFRDDISGIGIVPYFGVYGEPSGWSTPMWQYRFGLRAGYQFSTETNFRPEVCDIEGRSASDFTKCSNAVMTAVASVSFLESVKLEMTYSFLPLMSDKTKRADYFSLLFGWQF